MYLINVFIEQVYFLINECIYRFHMFTVPHIIHMYLIAVSGEVTDHQLNLVGFEAQQSSLYNDLDLSERAIDGNGNTDYHQGYCTHTSGDDMAWWSVDMTKEQSITKVEVVNRGDCCGKSKSLISCSVNTSY